VPLFVRRQTKSHLVQQQIHVLITQVVVRVSLQIPQKHVHGVILRLIAIPLVLVLEHKLHLQHLAPQHHQ